MSDLSYGRGLEHIKVMVEQELGKELTDIEFSVYYIRYLQSRNNSHEKIAAGICNEYYKEKDKQDIAEIKAALSDGGTDST